MRQAVAPDGVDHREARMRAADVAHEDVSTAAQSAAPFGYPSPQVRREKKSIAAGTVVSKKLRRRAPRPAIADRPLPSAAEPLLHLVTGCKTPRLRPEIRSQRNRGVAILVIAGGDGHTDGPDAPGPGVRGVHRKAGTIIHTGDAADGRGDRLRPRVLVEGGCLYGTRRAGRPRGPSHLRGGIRRLHGFSRLCGISRLCSIAARAVSDIAGLSEAPAVSEAFPVFAVLVVLLGLLSLVVIIAPENLRGLDSLGRF